jgi:hypothetical protein
MNSENMTKDLLNAVEAVASMRSTSNALRIDPAVIKAIDDKINMGDYKAITMDEWMVIREKLNVKDHLPGGQQDASTDIDLKKGLVEASASQDGYCYTRFLWCIREFHTCTFAEATRALSWFRALDTFPSGTKVLTELTLIQGTFLGHTYAEADRMFRQIFSECTDRLLHSGARFKWSEKDGVFHVEAGEELTCSCTDIVCEHGMSAKFILTAIVSKESRIGGSPSTIDINDFLQSIDRTQQDSESGTELAPMEPDSYTGFKVTSNLQSSWDADRPVREEFYKLRRELDELRDQVSMVKPVKESSSANPAGPSQQEGFRPSSLGIKANVVKERVEHALESSDEEIVETVGPNDSSSVMGRYQRNYMRPGSIVTARQVSKTDLAGEQAVVSYRMASIPEVVQGFVKTKELQSRELDSISRIKPVNGLAKPLGNNRLNFLAHVHTAIASLRGSETETMLAIIKSISRRSTMTPSVQLLSQVILRTFDFESRVVTANPYNLPYIEVGMQVSDNSVLTCFSLLKSEYKNLWFQEWKSLMVPDFSDEYSFLRDDEIQRIGGRRHSRQLGSESPSNRPAPQSKSRRSKSVFSVSN